MTLFGVLCLAAFVGGYVLVAVCVAEADAKVERARDDAGGGRLAWEPKHSEAR